MPAWRSHRVRGAAMTRLVVRKTYKLYIGGAFPRSESGRSYVVRAADGTPLANAVRGSRKDVRDAVRAARAAFPGWDSRTAMNRGQILYRVAELMEGRREQFVAEVAAAEGLDAAPQRASRWIGPSTAGSGTPAGQTRSARSSARSTRSRQATSTSRSPRPRGSSASSRPSSSSLLGLVSRLAPVVVSGNTAVVLASESRPLPAVTLTEVLATSDVPGGVINLITGTYAASSCPGWRRTWTSTALDLFGVPADMRTAAEEAAVESMKRVARPPRDAERFDWLDDERAQRPEWIAALPGDEDGLAPHRGVAEARSSRRSRARRVCRINPPVARGASRPASRARPRPR